MWNHVLFLTKVFFCPNNTVSVPPYLFSLKLEKPTHVNVCKVRTKAPTKLWVIYALWFGPKEGSIVAFP